MILFYVGCSTPDYITPTEAQIPNTLDYDKVRFEFDWVEFFFFLGGDMNEVLILWGLFAGKWLSEVTGESKDR